MPEPYWNYALPWLHGAFTSAATWHGDSFTELAAQEKSDEQIAADWTVLEWSWNPLATNEQAIIDVSASNIIEELGDERSSQEGREGMKLVVPVSCTDICHTFPIHETALNQHCLRMRKCIFVELTCSSSCSERQTICMRATCRSGPWRSPSREKHILQKHLVILMRRLGPHITYIIYNTFIRASPSHFQPLQLERERPKGF